MNKADRYFIDISKRLIEEGINEKDISKDVRPRWSDGKAAYTLFIPQIITEYERGEVPLTSIRRIYWESGLKEILWIYRDKSNDVNLFSEKYGVNYWDKWKNEDGSLGTSYGYQIAKKFISPESKELTDQIDRLIYNIKNNPLNRRHFTSLIDFTDLHKMTLIPCAFMTMWTVEDGYLDLSLIQRSGDFLAAASPGGINEIQYYLLLLIIAKETSLKPGRFVHFTQNLHIYDRHIEILKEIISDENIEILKENKSNPRFSIKNDKGFYDLELDDFVLEGYKPILKKYNIEIAE